MKAITPIKTHPIGDAFAIFAAVFVFCGAVYFGLASCGGYAWHKQLFRYLAPAIVIISVLMPSKLLRSTSRKITFLFILAIGYAVLEATSSTIYFNGGNWREYGRSFFEALEFGPC